MSKFDSFSAVAQSASTMEDPSGHPAKARRRPSPTTTTASTTTTGDSDGEVEAAAAAAEQGDPKAWAAFNKSFHQVQSMLDRNRLLIQQVNDNHQSRIPDNMVKNVSLIQELNGNISKVVSLYSDLNSNLSTMCQQHADNRNGRREN